MSTIFWMFSINYGRISTNYSRISTNTRRISLNLVVNHEFWLISQIFECFPPKFVIIFRNLVEKILNLWRKWLTIILKRFGWLRIDSELTELTQTWFHPQKQFWVIWPFRMVESESSAGSRVIDWIDIIDAIETVKNKILYHNICWMEFCSSVDSYSILVQPHFSHLMNKITKTHFKYFFNIDYCPPSYPHAYQFNWKSNSSACMPCMYVVCYVSMKYTYVCML